VRFYSSAITVANRFYMLVDRPSESTWLSAESTACGGLSVLCHQSLLAITGTTTPSSADLAAKKGWYLALAAEEQVVTSSVTAYGTTVFNTHTPANPSVTTSICRADRDLGTAKTYSVSYVNAAPRGTSRFDVVVGGGLSPPPAIGRVRLDDQSTRDVIIGADPGSFLRPRIADPGTSFSQPKGRVYWFTQR